MLADVADSAAKRPTLAADEFLACPGSTGVSGS
jgi:hypothetical protein